MDLLAAARDGWINLLPGVPQEDVREPPRQSALSGLFGPRLPDVTMATFMPPAGGRRATDSETIGLMHPIGKRALPLLREAGVPLPDGWRVKQDHVRRGLVVEVPASTSHARVLDWMLQAGTALCVERMTGTWRADVYWPGRAGGSPDDGT
jgi:hypothetical protein